MNADDREKTRRLNTSVARQKLSQLKVARLVVYAEKLGISREELDAQLDLLCIRDPEKAVRTMREIAEASP